MWDRCSGAAAPAIGTPAPVCATLPSRPKRNDVVGALYGNECYSMDWFLAHELRATVSAQKAARCRK